MSRKILLLPLLLILMSSVTWAQSPLPMLPTTDDGSQNVDSWLMSEKLDGVRGYWDGKQLLSKNGIPFTPPAEFTNNFPDFPLEGEIWGGRQTFAKTISIVKKKDGQNWLTLKFAIFDVPKAPGGFTDRIKVAEQWFAAHPSATAFIIEQSPVRNRRFMERHLQKIQKTGGEGLIVRRPDAPYSPGRSKDILKVKGYEDSEAKVLEYIPGSGRNKGRMGSLLVELPDSKIQFKVGSGFSDQDRTTPPPVGSLITFKYNGFYESGIPRFPAFVRIYRDESL
ncbi:MAG: DNA ligase [Proteobacteria bacterium]|nr:DNA ligase [Pseudomonadota bacterium]MBU1688297.1 DNA ligase [Pseudomonadota bacterium]